MRVSITLAIIALATMPVAVSAQPAPAAPAAPPAAAPAGRYTTATTEIGTLLDNPASKAVLAKHLPALVSNPQFDQARSMKLKDIQQFVPGLTDQTLADIDADLAKLP